MHYRSHHGDAMGGLFKGYKNPLDIMKWSDVRVSFFPPHFTAWDTAGMTPRWTWILTVPAAAAISSLSYWLIAK